MNRFKRSANISFCDHRVKRHHFVLFDKLVREIREHFTFRNNVQTITHNAKADRPSSCPRVRWSALFLVLLTKSRSKRFAKRLICLTLMGVGESILKKFNCHSTLWLFECARRSASSCARTRTINETVNGLSRIPPNRQQNAAES